MGRAAGGRGGQFDCDLTGVASQLVWGRLGANQLDWGSLRSQSAGEVRGANQLGGRCRKLPRGLPGHL
eukprot:5258322-Karenia_brevis.AAC.1